VSCRWYRPDGRTKGQADDGNYLIGRLQTRARQFIAALLKEKLEPGRAAAAVFLGIFIGIVPIYGFQTLAAVSAALLFRLNKPLTVAGTFINNPLLQPAIIVSSVEIGYFLRDGSFRAFHLSALTGAHMKEEMLAFVIGSVVLGVLVGGVGAATTAVVIKLKAPKAPAQGLRDRVRFVKGMFAQCAWADREFVRWKLRLDRIFGLLADEDLGSGTVVDLGCGYGMALSFAAFGDSSRRLVGCDLDGHRIAVARQALSVLNADLSVGDIRSFELPPAGVILILDVLQYLGADEQMTLLQRCCSALEPQGGVLIFRVHDRERGFWSTITIAFDRLIFAFGRAGIKPLTLRAAEYRSVLENAGMRVQECRFRNRLPLAHILFIARKPLAEAAT
jgi:uncharacterized protein (DUF2062 family)/SAM-dependent methyltransferase